MEERHLCIVSVSMMVGQGGRAIMAGRGGLKGLKGAHLK